MYQAEYGRMMIHSLVNQEHMFQLCLLITCRISLQEGEQMQVAAKEDFVWARGMSVNFSGGDACLRLPGGGLVLGASSSGSGVLPCRPGSSAACAVPSSSSPSSASWSDGPASSSPSDAHASASCSAASSANISAASSSDAASCWSMAVIPALSIHIIALSTYYKYLCTQPRHLHNSQNSRRQKNPAGIASWFSKCLAWACMDSLIEEQNICYSIAHYLSMLVPCASNQILLHSVIGQIEH